MTPIYILITAANICLLVVPVTSVPLPKSPKAPKYNLASPEARYGPLAAEPVPISIHTWLHNTPLVTPGSDVQPPIIRPLFNPDHASGVESWLEKIPMDLANQIPPIDVGGPKTPDEYTWDLSHSPDRQRFDHPYEIPEEGLFSTIFPGVDMPDLLERNGYSRLDAAVGLPEPLTGEGKVNSWLSSLPDMPSSVIEANLPANIDITHTGFGDRFMTDSVVPSTNAGWGGNGGDFEYDSGYDYNQEGNYGAVYNYDLDYSQPAVHKLDFSTTPETSTLGGAWSATTSAVGNAWDWVKGPDIEGRVLYL
ncbi:hypothetical protein BZA77DRAFT_369488 [Pyronema omphalodes]|nr:hypothetical protein BZA77DRAFT_369488 [Pyronema omphalodes]